MPNGIKPLPKTNKKENLLDQILDLEIQLIQR